MATTGTSRRPPKSFSPPKSVLFVGPYCITKQVGEGAFSSVFLATHVVNGEQVAIKVLHKPTLMRSETAFRFATREYSVLERVRGHPNVINLIRRIDTDEYTCLVMEYLPGGDLLHVMQGGTLTLKRTFHWFYQLVGALEFCHRNGICHRDIKLENILLDEHDRIRLCDFGMANFKSSNAMQFTTYCGSPHYISPEIARGEKYDAVKCDVWSLGVVLYALTCKRLPFNDIDTTQVIQKVLLGKYSVPPTCGEGLTTLITQMLTVDPAKRITLAQIKKTKFWRDGCLAFGLNVEGVSNIIHPSAASIIAGPSSAKLVVTSLGDEPARQQQQPGSPMSPRTATSPMTPKCGSSTNNWGGFDALSAVCSSIEEHTLLRVDSRQVEDVQALQDYVAGLQQLCRALAAQGFGGKSGAARKTPMAVGGDRDRDRPAPVSPPVGGMPSPQAGQRGSGAITPRAVTPPDAKCKIRSVEKIDKLEEKGQPVVKEGHITPRRSAPEARPFPAELLNRLHEAKTPTQKGDLSDAAAVVTPPPPPHHQGVSGGVGNVMIDSANIVNINGVTAVMVPVPVPVPVAIPVSLSLTNQQGKGAFAAADTKTPAGVCPVLPSPRVQASTPKQKNPSNADHKTDRTSQMPTPKWFGSVIDKIKKKEKR